MDASELKQIKDFIEQCKSNPSILEHPEISFFREYIEGLGRKIPSSGGDYKEKRVDKKIEYECQRRGTEPQAGFKRKKNEQSSSNRLDGMPGAGFPGGMLGGGFPYGMPGGIPMFGGFPGACFPRGLHRGFPDGMPGGYPSGEFPGGIPEGYITEYCQVFSDPELSAAFQNPRIFSKLRDLVLNPDNLAKHESDPNIAPILAKLKNICAHQ